MLSKMAQPNSVGAGGGGGSGTTASGRRVPLSLSGAGAGSLSRLQQAAAGSNGRSSPQNSNTGKKNESNIAHGPFVSIKKTSANQQRTAPASSSSTTSSSSLSKDEKNQNGNSKSTNGNSKAGQNGSSIPVPKEHQKHKEKQPEKKESKDEPKPNKSDVKIAETAAVDTKVKPDPVAIETIELDDEPAVVSTTVSTTPTSERKASRRLVAASQQKSPMKASPKESPIKPQPKESPIKPQPTEPQSTEPQLSESANKPQPTESPVQKKQEEPAEAVEDVEMEPLAVDASPIRSVATGAQPAATSTPGRNLFGFLSASKPPMPANEVERAPLESTTPSVAAARNLSQISGRRSIRPTTTFTPGRMGNYRCLNTSELDTSSCTNTSMNATVGSEIPNSSSFSFSFFGRGRKRERTPPPLSGSQSANDLAQDVEMSPPKRARFDLFSMNLISPFTMLRSRFSKAAISSPSSRRRFEQTPPTGEDEEGGGEVQNVSGIIIQEEEKVVEQQIDKSSTTDEVTVGKEAGLETPKKSGTPDKNVADVTDENTVGDKGEDAVANLPAMEVGSPAECEGPNRSRCAIM